MTAPLSPELPAKVDVVAESIRKSLAETGLVGRRLTDVGDVCKTVVATVIRQLETAEAGLIKHLKVTCTQNPLDKRELNIRITPLTDYGRTWLPVAKLQEMGL
jgi:hypothetical protein